MRSLARHALRSPLLALLLPAALLVTVLPRPAQGSEAAARAVVERLHRVLSEHLSPPPRSFEDRLGRLAPLLEESFDFETITRVALGKSYSDLDAAARTRFQGLLTRLSAVTYADRFSTSEAEERFVTVESRPARRGQTLVRTRLERDGDDPVSLDYVLLDSGTGLRITNVLADGVSDLSLKRAEYAAVIRREGAEGLERRLSEQVRNLEKRASESGGSG